jgi:hypothetical protein
MNRTKTYLIVILLSVFGLTTFAQGYKNFKVAVYCRAYEVQKMGDLNWLNSAWDELSKGVHVDKIYLETHRDRIIVNEDTLKTAIKFF